MPTLVTTPGATTANSYGTLVEADAYFDERVQASAWTGESDDDVHARALIMATRDLDLYEYKGIKSSSAQALKWPREGVCDQDGEEYASDAIPTFLKHATFERALDILNANAESEDPLADDGLSRFDRAKIGPLEVEINHSASSAPLPSHVLALIRHVRLNASGMMATLERM